MAMLNRIEMMKPTLPPISPKIIGLAMSPSDFITENAVVGWVSTMMTVSKNALKNPSSLRRSHGRPLPGVVSAVELTGVGAGVRLVGCAGVGPDAMAGVSPIT